LSSDLGLPAQRGVPRPFVWEAFLWFACLSLLLVVVPAAFITLPGLAILSLAVAGTSLWMMHRLVGLFNLRKVTIPAFFYYVYCALILIPGFYIFTDELTSSRWHFLFGIESVLISVPIGIAVANLIYGFNRKRIAPYFDRPVETERLSASSIRLFVAFLAAGVLFVLINVKEMPVIPLLYVIRHPGEALIAAAMREDSFKLLQSHLTYVYFVLRGTIFPFLILVAYARYRRQRHRSWGVLFLISLVIGIGYASLTIEKSPVAAIFGLLFVFYYLFCGGRVGRAASITSLALFFCFPLAVVLLAYNGSEGGTIGGALHALGVRIFYSPAQIVYTYFEVFPSVIPYQHGASITKLAGFLGKRALDIPNAIGLYMTEGTDLNTITANSCFIGNLNADFGLPGVVVGGILAGFLMQAVSIHFCRGPKNAVTLAAHAICIWAFGMLIMTALPTTLLSGGVAFAFILCWIFGRSEKRSCSLSPSPTAAFASGNS